MSDCLAPSVQELTVGAPIIYQFLQADGVTPVDLRTATGLKIKLASPSGATYDKAASLSTPPGTDGKIVYFTLANDLNEVGRWTVQGWITLAGSLKPGQVFPFFVLANVDNA